MILRFLLINKPVIDLSIKYEWVRNLVCFLLTGSNKLSKENQKKLERSNRESLEQLERELELTRIKNSKSYKFDGKVYKANEYIYKRNLNEKRLIDTMKRERVGLSSAINIIESEELRKTKKQ